MRGGAGMGMGMGAGQGGLGLKILNPSHPAPPRGAGLKSHPIPVVRGKLTWGEAERDGSNRVEQNCHP